MNLPKIAKKSPILKTFQSLEAPHYGYLFASGWLFSVSRWGVGFLGGFVMNEMTGSPLYVQLTGTFMWGPLLLAGLVGGAISDRFDRKRTVMAFFLLMVPVTILMGGLALLDLLKPWIVFLSMLVVGVGWVIDMTARRALIYDLVGPAQINNALALEMFSSASGLALGALLGGTIVELLGVGYAYWAVAIFLTASVVSMAKVPSISVTDLPVGEGFFRTMFQGLRELSGNHLLFSVLGVTLIADFFFFSYTPLLQVIGERVGGTPFSIGLLVASAGVGMMVGSLWVAAFSPSRGLAYVWGAFSAMVLVIGLAITSEYGWVLFFAMVSAVSFGLFGATQGALTMTSVKKDMRGRAMGLLSMAIGSLPIGMYILGLLAEKVGAENSIIIFNVTGIATLVLFLVWRPQVLRAH